MKNVYVSVINDLVTDQRVHKSCTSMQKAGFKVFLIGRRLRNSPPMDTRSYSCKRMRLYVEKGPLFYAWFNIRLFFLLLFSKQDLLVSNDLDTLLPNFIISRLKRIPLVYDSHEYFTETPELTGRPIVQKVWKAIEKYVLSRMDEMITVNESIAGLFREKYGIVVHVVRNVPFRLHLKPESSREQLNLPANKRLLILQGSGINIQRGAEELVLSMKYIDDSLLLIIGGGDVLPVLKQMCKANKLDDKIMFLPRMPYAELIKYTTLADLGFTLDKPTNLNYRFSLPNKLFDFIQAGVPVIASDLPEIRRIIESYQIGNFIPSHEPEDIARVIRESIDNKALRTKWKNNLTFAAHQLCWENEEKVLLKIYGQYS
ncbi:MAG: glycosyltransferase [Bacteroidetes bacterium]|nr:glycosyltransferase [Bacteroidota bacterium]MBU1580408.1 glycosyltransferase [Bacteroidota bacterium]